jgi:cysteine-rich repeat protein
MHTHSRFLALCVSAAALAACPGPSPEVPDAPPMPVCGNGSVEAGEACDDGNRTSGDGCENNCTPTPPDPPPVKVDIDSSLFISPTTAADQELLRSRFGVSRIMDRILASAGVARPANGAELFQRWWDTQNSSASAVFPDNPHCDDNKGTINGFPVQCPRNEGALAKASPDSHFPIALVYRPDLTPRDGSTCGEARIVIAKSAGPDGRNLAIFETSIPNPDPGCGLTGCRKIAEFWANLSKLPELSQRLDALERFYFSGLELERDGVATKAALDVANLGLPDQNKVRRGQIRTNQFMFGAHHGPSWQLREFKLAIECEGTPGDCKLLLEPVRVDTNPAGVLFNDNDPNLLGESFRAEFLGQIQSLAADDVNAIGMVTGAGFNAGQSGAQTDENDYLEHLGRGNPAGFEQAITDKLASLGSSLTAKDIAARATTQSCGGCHQISNGAELGRTASGALLVWPPSSGFVHVSEDGGRSPALNDVFLPKRKQILEQFLRDTSTGACVAPLRPDPTPLAGKPMVH